MKYGQVRIHPYERDGDTYIILLVRNVCTLNYHLYWLKNGFVQARANLGQNETSALLTYEQEVHNLEV